MGRAAGHGVKELAIGARNAVSLVAPFLFFAAMAGAERMITSMRRPERDAIAPGGNFPVTTKQP